MMGEYLPELLLAWSIQLTGVLSPGPSVALILGVATTRGRGPALITALGIGTGAIVLALATVVGLTAVFAQVAEVMTFVRIAGASYLLWLAYGAFRKAMSPPALNIAEVPKSNMARTWMAGFLLQISNPKAIFFWLAIASLGGLGAAPLPVIALFVAGAFVNSFCGHGAWALILSAKPIRNAYQSARRPIEALLGSFYVFAAYRLATARS